LYDIIRQSVFGDVLTDNDFITLSLDQRLVHLKNILKFTPLSVKHVDITLSTTLPSLATG